MTPQHGRRAQLLVMLEGQEFRFALEREVTSVGSDADCGLSVRGPGVEPRHCVIQRAAEGFEIFDLFSEGGTRVNGTGVEAHLLLPGDRIEVGGVKFVYLESAVPAGSRDSANRRVGPPQAATPAPIPFAPPADPWETWQEAPFFEPAHLPSVTTGTTPPRRPQESEDPAPPPSHGFWQGLQGWRARRAAERMQRAESRVRTSEAAGTPLAGHAVQALPIPTLTARQVRALVAPATHRFRSVSFRREIVEQLRATPFLAISLVVHICLAIILSLIAQPGPPTFGRGTFNSGMEAMELYRQEDIEEDAPVEEISPEAPDDRDIQVEEPTVDVEDFDPPPMGDETNTREGPPTPDFEAAGAAAAAASSLKGGAGLGARVGGAGFRKYVSGLRESGLDIVIVIDSTGSMGNVIEDARRHVDRMIATIGSLVPAFRLGVVAFRDHSDAYVTRELPLTGHPYEAVAFLDGLEADGGRDTPEAVFAGMKSAIQMTWAPRAKRIVILIGDAPPHEEDMEPLARLLRRFSRQGEVHTLQAARARSPEAAHVTEIAFRMISREGNGVSARIDQSSDVIRRIIEAALGPGHREDVAEAISAVETGWRKEHFARLVATGSEEALREALRRRPPQQLLFRELMHGARPEILGVCLDTVADERAPMEARWAATVVAKRILERTRDLRVRSAASSLSPEGPPYAVQRRVVACWDAARMAGLKLPVRANR